MKDIIVDNSYLYTFLLQFVHYFGMISKIVFVVFIIGVFSDKPESYIFINFIVKIVMSIFLIYRFNKYRGKIEFTELDRKLCYSAGLYILLFSFADIIQIYIAKLRDKINNYTFPIIENINKEIENITKKYF